MLVAAGPVASYVPGVPRCTLDAHIVLPCGYRRCGTQPPSTARTSTCGPVALLSVGYVLFATLAVGRPA